MDANYILDEHLSTKKIKLNDLPLFEETVHKRVVFNEVRLGAVFLLCFFKLLNILTVKPVLRGHSKRRTKLVFKTNYRLMQVKSIAECSNGSILQYFGPSLSYHLSLRSLFCLFLSGCLRQVLQCFKLCAILFDCLIMRVN